MINTIKSALTDAQSVIPQNLAKYTNNNMPTFHETATWTNENKTGEREDRPTDVGKYNYVFCNKTISN